MKSRVALIFLMALAGCAIHAPVTSPAICPEVKKFTPAEQRSMADALDALPATNPINSMLAPNWEQMRDDARACRGN